MVENQPPQEQATPQPQAAPETQPAPPKPSKTPIVIMSVITVLSLLFSGYLAYQNIQLKGQIEQPTAPPAPTETLDPTESWETYTSSKAGYLLKHPEQWPLIQIPVSTGCNSCIENVSFTPSYDPNSGDNTLGTILVFQDERVKTLDDYINLFIDSDSSKIDRKTATIDNKEAISYKLSGGIPPLPIIEYVVVNKDFYYIIRIEDSRETNKDKETNIEIFNQILSTFEFIE